MIINCIKLCLVDTVLWNCYCYELLYFLKVYLAGFQYEQREKLSKILNLSGATRYDDISDRVTHVIVGDPTCPEVKLIKTKNYSLSLVSVYWLLNSMEQQHAADEEKYLIKLHDSDKEQFSSPLGRKVR